MMKYSPSLGCFYPPDIQYEELPSDLIDVSQDEFSRAMNRTHDQILCVVNGRVDVQPMPEPDAIEVKHRACELERFWRDGVLRITDNLVARHRDEIEEKMLTTLVMEQFTELQSYRRELRKWPEAFAFPSVEARPLPPLWLENVSQ